MSVRSKHLKIVGAAGAAALTVGALSAPALSAPGDLTATATYSCLNGAINATGDFTVAPPSTTSLVAGQKVTSAATLHVVLPILRPTILVLGCLTVVYAFKSFDFIYVMTGGGPGTSSSTLPFLSWKLSFAAYEYGRGAAVAVIAMILVSAFSFVYVRSVNSEVRL